MARKNVNAVSDKLTKVAESFQVYMYDNGYMFEISGQDRKGDWATCKIMVGTVEHLFGLISEVIEMERS